MVLVCLMDAEAEAKDFLSHWLGSLGPTLVGISPCSMWWFSSESLEEELWESAREGDDTRIFLTSLMEESML